MASSVLWTGFLGAPMVLRGPVWSPQERVSAFCGCCGPVGFIGPEPPVRCQV